MEISIIKDADFVSQTGLVDNTTPWDNSYHVEYNQGMELQNDNQIFVRSGGNFRPPEYDSNEDLNYMINDIVFKDSKVSYCTAPIDMVRKQPSQYADTDTSTDFSAWTNRYSLLGVLANDVLEFITGNTTHRIYKDGTSPTGWVHRTTTRVLTDANWQIEVYDKDNNMSWSPSKNELYATVDNYNLVHGIDSPGPTPYVTELTSTYSSPVPIGTVFRCGSYRTYDEAWGRDRYGYQQEGETWSDVISYYYPVVTYNITNDSIEELAVCASQSNCSEEWYSRFLVIEGTNIYVRTGVVNASIEYATLSSPLFKEMVSLYEAGGWGWTYSRPTTVYAPIDGKKYTYFDVPSPVTYRISGGGNFFDTVAMNGLIANEVDVTFIPSDGSLAIPMFTLYPKTNRDSKGRLPSTITTIPAYAPRDIRGDVELTFRNNGNVRLGGVRLGQSTNAGFTNLVFTNKFTDRSPNENDQWGNIVYTPGVKTNIYTGTTDVPISDYDMINRLMTSIGGETVILNGSDTKDNAEIDGENFFASTMVVGRIRNFALKTKLDNKVMHQMATYSFEIEEDV